MASGIAGAEESPSAKRSFPNPIVLTDSFDYPTGELTGNGPWASLLPPYMLVGPPGKVYQPNFNALDYIADAAIAPARPAHPGFHLLMDFTVFNDGGGNNNAAGYLYIKTAGGTFIQSISFDTGAANHINIYSEHNSVAAVACAFNQRHRLELVSDGTLPNPTTTVYLDGVQIMSHIEALGGSALIEKVTIITTAYLSYHNYVALHHVAVYQP